MFSSYLVFFPYKYIFISRAIYREIAFTNFDNDIKKSSF